MQQLCTADHGVPQNRHRMYLVAIRLDSLRGDIDNVRLEPLAEKAHLLLSKEMLASFLLLTGALNSRFSCCHLFLNKSL